MIELSFKHLKRLRTYWAWSVASNKRSLWRVVIYYSMYNYNNNNINLEMDRL